MNIKRSIYSGSNNCPTIESSTRLRRYDLSEFLDVGFTEGREIKLMLRVMRLHEVMSDLVG